MADPREKKRPKSAQPEKASTVKLETLPFLPLFFFSFISFSSISRPSSIISNILPLPFTLFVPFSLSFFVFPLMTQVFACCV